MATPYTPVPAELVGDVTLPDDGDLATAQSVNDPFKEVLDAAQLSQNKLNGTSDGATLTNPVVQGIVIVQNNGPDRSVSIVSQDVAFDDDSSLTLNGGGSAPDVEIDRNLNVLGTAMQVTSSGITSDGAVIANQVGAAILGCTGSFSATSTQVETNKILDVRSGIAHRVYNLPDADETIDVSLGDVFVVPNITADRSYGISATGATEGQWIRFTAFAPFGSYKATVVILSPLSSIQMSNNPPMAGVTQSTCADYRFTGGAWTLENRVARF